MTENARSGDLKTVCLLAAVLAAAGLYYGSGAAAWAAAALLLCALVSPRAAARVSAAWLAFSALVGKYNTRLLLILIFFLVLIPVAFLRRLFSGDTLNTGKKGEGSYYRKRGGKFTAGDLENLW